MAEDQLKISDGDTTLIVSPQGGTILSWQFRDHHILFPYQQVLINGILKIRGGMFVAFPNFGPAPRGSKLPQHGFLRDTVANTFKPHADLDQLVLNMVFWAQGNFIVKTRVQLLTAALGFTYEIVVKGVGGFGNTEALCPGFHPYFRTPLGKAEVHFPNDPIIDGIYPEIVEPALVVPTTSPAFIHIPGVGVITMSTSGARKNGQTVIWRDSLAYLCVEPVAADPPLFGTEAGFSLGSGEEFCYRLECRFEPEKAP